MDGYSGSPHIRSILLHISGQVSSGSLTDEDVKEFQTGLPKLLLSTLYSDLDFETLQSIAELLSVIQHHAPEILFPEKNSSTPLLISVLFHMAYTFSTDSGFLRIILNIFDVFLRSCLDC